mgnify:CR=1 FL=1|tara:strand:+ start:5206 stop:5922 length:717 start_codon:yes stop_codon:yes gene_type:complete
MPMTTAMMFGNVPAFGTDEYDEWREATARAMWARRYPGREVVEEFPDCVECNDSGWRRADVAGSDYDYVERCTCVGLKANDDPADAMGWPKTVKMTPLNSDLLKKLRDLDVGDSIFLHGEPTRVAEVGLAVANYLRRRWVVKPHYTSTYALPSSSVRDQGEWRRLLGHDVLCVDNMGAGLERYVLQRLSEMLDRTRNESRKSIILMGQQVDDGYPSDAWARLNRSIRGSVSLYWRCRR